MTVLNNKKCCRYIKIYIRIFKNEFKARPVYVRTKESIEAHFLICFLALLIYRILENKLDNQFTCREIDLIHRKFSFRTDYEAIEHSNLKTKIIEKRVCQVNCVNFCDKITFT